MPPDIANRTKANVRERETCFVKGFSYAIFHDNPVRPCIGPPVRGEQYDRGWQCHRKHPCQVKIVGDPVRGRILFIDVKEKNGALRNGRREAVV
jgi:hypothetical protein